MKDDWISRFQEKLGDYELDVPVPAPARNRRWLLPVFATAAAAAAALALLLWLPAGKDAAPSGTTPRIAEEQPALQDEIPALPDTRLLAQAPASRRAVHIAVRETVPATPEASETVETVTPPDENPVIPHTPDTPQKPEEPETPQNPAATRTWVPDFQPDITDRTAARPLSFQVFAGNLMPGSVNTPAQAFDSPLIFSVSMADGEDTDWQNNSWGLPKSLFSKNAVIDRTFGNPDIRLHCQLPLKTGLSVRYAFTPHLAVESGLTYSYHRARQGMLVGVEELTVSDWRLHYLGIPVKAVETAFSGKWLDLYFSEGGEIEMLAGGTCTRSQTGEKTGIREHPLQLSVLAAAGADIHLTKRLALYAEPGIAWHPLVPEDLPNYYREHPVSFDLRFGLRVDL